MQSILAIFLRKLPQIRISNMPKRLSSHDDKNKATEISNSPKKGKYEGENGRLVYKDKVIKSENEARERDGYSEPIPKRNSKRVVIFPDAKEFSPNMTPMEVLQAGSFGGTYFRPIKSAVTGLKYDKMWNELPQEWLEGWCFPIICSIKIYSWLYYLGNHLKCAIFLMLEFLIGLDKKRVVYSSLYDESVNTYKVKCGGSLDMWEQSGWIIEQDPYGWFMWYCRFYLGR